MFWYFDHPFNPTNGVPYQSAFAQGVSGGTANSAASNIAREAANAGQAAFAHAPFPAGGNVPPPQLPHHHASHPHAYPYPNPQINYSSWHRYGRRGPRLFPLLVVGGVGAWTYCHLKHQIWDLSDEVKSLKHIVFSQSQASQRQRQDVEVQPEPEPVAVPDNRRRRTWERRWGDKGENMAKVSVVQDKLV